MRELEQIKMFLNRSNFDGFTKKDLFIKRIIGKEWGQDIAALSNMAEALANIARTKTGPDEDFKELLGEVVKRSIHPKVNPYKKQITKVSSLGGFGYYLEHLNIVLGCYRMIADDQYHELNTRITEHLVKLSNQSSNYHAKLIPWIRMKWAADQAAIIYSIWLYDQNNGTSYHHELAENWVTIMRSEFTHQSSGLYQTEVERVKRYSKQPRGCSLSYLIYYMSFFNRNEALTQWGLYKEKMHVSYGPIKGFREYLRGYKGGWNPDSGPVVFGLGIAATGLAYKTAKALGDDQTSHELFRIINPIAFLMRLAKPIPLINIIASLGSDLLASSIILCAKSIQHERLNSDIHDRDI